MRVKQGPMLLRLTPELRCIFLTHGFGTVSDGEGVLLQQSGPTDYKGVQGLLHQGSLGRHNGHAIPQAGASGAGRDGGVKGGLRNGYGAGGTVP